MWTFMNGFKKKKRISCKRILYIQFNLHPIVLTKSLRMSGMQLQEKNFYDILSFKIKSVH